MVTLASSAKGNSVVATATATSLKSPMRQLDRQQSSRCSKKLKRNQQNDSHLSITTSTLKQTEPIDKFMSFNSRVLSSEFNGAGDELPVQMLACYEDSSFIYNQNSPITTATTISGANPFAPSTRRSAASSGGSSSLSHSTTDSMISSSPANSSPAISFSSTMSTTLKNQHRLKHSQTLNSSDYYSSASPSCISALDYCHLYSSHSSSPSIISSSSRLKSYPLAAANKQRAQVQQDFKQDQATAEHQIPSTLADPVYLEDVQVFHNLIAKERAELRKQQQHQQVELPLSGQARHSLLSWMLKVCEHQMCQDEIFSLATMILDKFLMQQQSTALNNKPKNGSEEDDDFKCYEDELRHRQLYLFAACSLLLATKLRQTPRLSIQTLIEHSESELSVQLNREEIYDGELLLLAALKWDLAALVTPNDFLTLLQTKCKSVAAFESSQCGNKDLDQDQDEIENKSEGEANKFQHKAATSGKWQHQHLAVVQNGASSATTTTTTTTISANKRCEESRVRRHTQTLLELCLMDTQLSRFPPSILAMSSMAVAIDGLSTNKTCCRLDDIVTKIHEATHEVNELKLMIDVAFQIEKYVQKLLNSTNDD